MGGTQSSSLSARHNTDPGENKSFLIKQQTAPTKFTNKIQRYSLLSDDPGTSEKNYARSDWRSRFKEKELYTKLEVDSSDGAITRLKVNIKNNLLAPEEKILVKVQEEPTHDGGNDQNRLDDDANKKGS